MEKRAYTKQEEVEFVFNEFLELLESVSLKTQKNFLRFIEILNKDKVDSILCDSFFSKLSALEISKLIKAFTIYQMLLNIIEERHTNKERAKQDYFSLEQTIDNLHKQGNSLEHIYQILRKIRFYPVFTAHPTESRRRTFLEADCEMSSDLDSWLNFGDKRAKEHLFYRLNLLWRSHIVRSQKIEVLFELDNLLYFLENSILKSSVKILDKVESILKSPLKKSIIKLGSWVGGDRDGNPFVTNEVMLGVMKRQHECIITLYLQEVEKLIRDLSIAEEFSSPTKELTESLKKEWKFLDPTSQKLFSNEPYRAKLMLIHKKLHNRLISVNVNDLFSEGNFTYANPKELIADVEMLINSLDDVSSQYLKSFRNFVLLAGFHLMKLDFREHREIFYNAISEIFSYLGYAQSDFVTLPKSTQTEILNHALSLPKIDLRELIGHLSEATEVLIWAFLRFYWAKIKISDSIIDSCIISMCKDANDLLCVLWFAKQSGLWIGGKKTRIAISPLLETIEDLENAGAIMQELCANPYYMSYLKSRKNIQEIMIGYSDSSKDGGIFSSNYSLYLAIGNLVALEEQLGVKFYLFHGRGGSVSRGGGALEPALLASPKNSVDYKLKITEQGEVISDKYLNPNKAEFNLKSALGALLKKSFMDSDKEIIEPSSEILSQVNLHSFKAYRKLVYETPSFIEYFKEATPIFFIQNLNIGSRPSKRKETHRVEDLRAIPWVFAWTQNRSIIPAWYGLGSGFQQTLETCGSNVESELKRLYENHLFFRATMDNIAQAMLKVDLEIANLYNDFVEDVGLKKQIWGMITAEFALTLRWILTLRSEKSLLENQKSLQESILFRKPFLNALNLSQVHLIHEYKMSDDKEEQNRLIEQILTTIVGITQGVRNAG